MIDEKKIEEAAYRFATSQTHGELLALIDGYKEGFKDAINESLKDLWHPVSEIPHSKDGYCSVYIFRKNKDISNVLYIEKENVWRELIDKCQGIAWCYINDLLPKEGSEQ